MKAVNPRTGATDCEFAAASAEQIAGAAARLRDIQPGWEALGPKGRALVFERLAERLEREGEAVTEALAIDTGRMGIAAREVAGVIGMLRKWAVRGPQLFADLPCEPVPSATPGIDIVPRYSAYPLFGAIAPWNFPMLLAHIDAIPALMAGCAALVKPSEITPRFVAPLAEMLMDFPELPLAHVLGGPDAGQALIENVDYVCFTGSTATGRKVAEAAARALIPSNLELGGKDPMIVTANADPVRAARIALRASVVASGQACQSIERLYIARAIAAPFMDELLRAAGEVGPTELGPFIYPAQAQKVAEQISAARQAGAKVLIGGEVQVIDGGHYLAPTVLTDVTPDMAVMREETFGPVIPVTVFDDVDEAVALANDTGYGLSAAVYAGSLDEAAAIGSRLDVGAVSLQDGALTSMVGDATNHSRKGSGLGPSRMGDEGLLRFLRRQALIRRHGDAPTLEAYRDGME